MTTFGSVEQFACPTLWDVFLATMLFLTVTAPLPISSPPPPPRLPESLKAIVLLVIVTVLSGLPPLVIPPPSRAVFPLIVEESMTRVAAAVGLPAFRIAPASPPSKGDVGALLPANVLRTIVSDPPTFATAPAESPEPFSRVLFEIVSAPALRMFPPK